MVRIFLLGPTATSLIVIRLCVETPTAGGRVFEKGDEYLLKFAHEIQSTLSTPVFTAYQSTSDYRSVPVVLVFTQYDRLVRSKKAELQEDYENMDEISLRNQSVKDASTAFEKCLQSVQRTMNRLNIPMPHCARVSGMSAGTALSSVDCLLVRAGYHEIVSSLVESTRDVVRERLRGDAWIMWAIAQRASPSVKLDACVT